MKYVVVLVYMWGLIGCDVHGAAKNGSITKPKRQETVSERIKRREKEMDDVLWRMSTRTDYMRGTIRSLRQLGSTEVIVDALEKIADDIQKNGELRKEYNILVHANELDRAILRKRVERMHDVAGVMTLITTIVVAVPHIFSGKSVRKISATRLKTPFLSTISCNVPKSRIRVKILPTVSLPSAIMQSSVTPTENVIGFDGIY